MLRLEYQKASSGEMKPNETCHVNYMDHFLTSVHTNKFSTLNVS